MGVRFEPNPKGRWIMTAAPRRILATCLVIAAAIAGLGIGADPPPPRSASGAPRVPLAFGPISPRLSGAGDQIAFSYQGALWRMPRSGGVMTRLTDGRGFDNAPAWSPDGTRIAYYSSPGFPAGALRVVRADDGTAVPLP